MRGVRFGLAALLVGSTACAASPIAVSVPPPGVFEEDPVFGGEIYLEEDGPEGAPLVVLLHGLGGSTSDYDEIVRALRTDHRTLTIDLPGFGRSSKPDTEYSPRRYVDALANLLSRRAPFHLVGHSLGGAVALLYAARHPRQVQSLVVMDAAGILHGSVIASGMVAEVGPTSTQRNVLRGLAERVLSDRSLSARQIMRSPFRRMLMLGSDPNRIAALGLGLENFAPVLPRVRAPVLVIWGAEDNIAPLRTGKLLVGRLPRARLEVLPGVGHVPMKAAPERTAALIRGMLASTLKPQDVLPRKPGTERLRLQGANGRVIEGSYDTIEIAGSNAILRNVVARAIKIDRSEVTIEDTVVLSDDVALEVSEAKLEATNVELRGRVAIEPRAARLDLAGATLVGTEAAIRVGRQRSSIVLSVSRIESPKTRGYLHGARKLASGASL